MLATDYTMEQIATCLVTGKKRQREYVQQELIPMGLGLKDFVEKTPAARAQTDLSLRSILFAIDF
jgi:hypothetical protein